MWLKYQQVTAKMSSFDPREIIRPKENENDRFPLKRFEPTLRSSMRVVLPMNLDRLRKHKSNIEKYAHMKNWKSLNIEQINASRTVQQLQATIRDLDKIKYQIIEEDYKAFQKQMQPIKDQASAAIQEFSQLQNLISVEVQKSIDNETKSDDGNCISTSGLRHPLMNAPLLSDDSSQYSEDLFLSPRTNEMSDVFTEGSITKQLHQGSCSSGQLQEEMAACQSWDTLRDSLLELNGLVNDFATIVNNQQEAVDRIEENIEHAQENVSTAAQFLAQASKYKAVAIPVAGAVIGGLVGGPIGLLAGFKLAGAAAAVGGSIAGYQGGKYLKKKHDEKVEVELRNLSTRDKMNTSA